MKEQLLIKEKQEKRIFTSRNHSLELETDLIEVLEHCYELEEKCGQYQVVFRKTAQDTLAKIMNEHQSKVRETIGTLERMAIELNIEIPARSKSPSSYFKLARQPKNEIIYSVMFIHKKVINLSKIFLSDIDRMRISRSISLKIREQLYFHKTAYWVLNAFI